ncbi:TniQ family protein [Streptomyces sp. NPDC002659]|uniref:TniQ family protein n=1 Tax=Streptomyces sp. NPDC002659 TaxID=3364656 RepID=UPI00369982A2
MIDAAPQPKPVSARQRSGRMRDSQSAPISPIRRLPVVPMPTEGEAFASWVDRTAIKLDVSPGAAARALGLEYRGNAAWPLFFGITLTPASLTGLQRATRLPAAVLQKMQLDRYDGTALNLPELDPANEATTHSALLQQWLLIGGSRACPHCLSQNAAWPLWWRLGIAAVCPIHRCLLVDTCPACGVALRRGAKVRPRVLLRRTHAPLDLKECGNRMMDPDRPRQPDVCRQRITDIPTQPVADSLVDIQQRALAIADGGAGLLAGKPVTGADWFAAVRFVTATARLVGHDDELAELPDVIADSLAKAREARRESRAKHSRGGVRDPGAMPETAAEAAAILALAAPVVDAPNRDGGPQYLAAWARRLEEERQTTHSGMDPLRKIERPSIVDQMMAATIPPTYRVASTKTTTSTAAFEIRHIPHLIDADDYHDLMAVHLPGVRITLGRHFASLALARLAGAGTWTQAAEALNASTRTERTYRRVAQRTPDRGAFWEATRSLADRMTARGLIDYQTRRTALSSLREVPHRVLFPLLKPMGMNATWQRQRHAAAWIWERLTGGRAQDAPTYADGWEGIKAPSITIARQRFHAELPSEAANTLTAWGMEWLAASSID